MAGRHHLGRGADGQAPGGGQAGGGDEEQHQEEEGDRDHLGQDRGQAGVDVARQVADAVLRDQTEGDGADERHRQAAQAPDHGGGEAVQGEQGELVRRQAGLPDHRGQEHAGQGGQHEAEDPAGLGHAVRLGPGHGHQLGVVDHGADGDAEADPSQEEAEPDRDQDRHDDEHDLLVLDGDAVAPEEVHREHGAVGLGEVVRHRADDVGAAPEDGGHAEQDHQQPERHHEGASTVAPWMRRKSTNSTAMASNGASMKTMTTMASRKGQCQSCHSCQYEKAATIPTAPWAKLKTPVVL